MWIEGVELKQEGCRRTTFYSFLPYRAQNYPYWKKRDRSIRRRSDHRAELEEERG
jgi:hypothetical protein